MQGYKFMATVVFVVTYTFELIYATRSNCALTLSRTVAGKSSIGGFTFVRGSFTYVQGGLTLKFDKHSTDL